MKTNRRFRGTWKFLNLLPLILFTLAVPCRAVPFYVSFFYPTNGQTFAAPAKIAVHASVTDSNVVNTVLYYSGVTLIGSATNTSGVLLTNSTQANPFVITWSNVPAGSYSLHALAIDSMGNSATSAPVNITVTNVVPPTPHPVTYIYSPSNNSVFLAPANLTIYSRAVESGGQIAAVQFLANNVSLGAVTISNQMVYTNISSEPLFAFSWPGVPAGDYELQTIAYDTNGNTGTSSVVNISVVTSSPPPNVPFTVSFAYPTNGQTFAAPANIYLHARVTDSNLVELVQYYSGTTFIGSVSNKTGVLVTNSTQSNPFFLVWSNVPAGSYPLTAVAIDSAGNMATSAPVNITVTSPQPPPPVPFTVSFAYPTNGQTFTAPANIYLHARVTDSNLVVFVQYFSGSTMIGVVSNSTGVFLTNSTQVNPFFVTWSNVPAGSYRLTAVAIDSAGNMATSAPVNITVTSPQPPPPVPFTVSFWYPVNGQLFPAPANIYLHARVTDSNLVELVQYYSGATFIGSVSNKTGVLVTNSTQSNPFFLVWSNVPAGSYSLTAIAIDNTGATATSAPVNIIVSNTPPPVVPFTVGFFYPTNGQMFAAPANVGIHARVTDSNLVQYVLYYSGATLIGSVSNYTHVVLTNSTQSNPFFLDWSNVPAGSYSLMAVAIDSVGNMATSGPVNIYVLTNLPAVVSIYAPDPVAIEGTNYQSWYWPPTPATNYFSGTNTATFLVRRDSNTNTDLTVYYSIGGTASNGVDYASIPNSVLIPAGQRYSLITILPLDDNDSSYRRYDNVTLSLIEPSNNPTAYIIGNPPHAGAVILEENFLPFVQPMIRNLDDDSLHVSLPATNGLNYCLQISTDLVNWLPVCTNTVLKGSAQYVDPGASSGTGIYYRIVPVDSPASY